MMPLSNRLYVLYEVQVREEGHLFVSEPTCCALRSFTGYRKDSVVVGYDLLYSFQNLLYLLPGTYVLVFPQDTAH